MSDFDFGYYIDARVPFCQTKRSEIIRLNPTHVSKRKTYTGNMHNNLHLSPLHEYDSGDGAARMSQFAKQDKIQQTDTPR